MSSKYTKEAKKIKKALKIELKKNNKRVLGIMLVDCLCNVKHQFYGILPESCLRDGYRTLHSTDF